MTFQTYGETERALYDPGPCPRCGATGAAVSWRRIGAPSGQRWIPGVATCRNRACPGKIGCGLAEILDRRESRPAC